MQESTFAKSYSDASYQDILKGAIKTAKRFNLLKKDGYMSPRAERMLNAWRKSFDLQ